MIRIYFNNLKKIKIENIGLFLFRIGILTLPSAFFVSVIILLSSLIIGFLIHENKFYRDKWNYPFVFLSILMPIICLLQQLNFATQNQLMGEWNPSLSWIGLFNWLPFFFIFWGFQPYLSTPERRKIAAKFFIFGTIPVLVSGIGQYLFNWHGPLETLYGLIIWYQRPISIDGGLTALFNNQNYAGAWFNIVWPFCIASFVEVTHNKLKASISLLIAISISVCIVLTNSRNAWGGLVLTLPLVLGTSAIYWFVIIGLLLFAILVASSSSEIFFNFRNYFESIIPEKILSEFNQSNFLDRETRLKIWLYGLKMAFNKPLLGWGAAIFPILYFSEFEKMIIHSHNLFIELSVSYGLIVSLVLLVTILVLIVLSYKKLNIQKSYSLVNSSLYFEKAWWASFIVLFFSQLIDVQYFDGRISISYWILLSGLREIIRE
tara:strand:+ start:147 stop:1445 length:1299 start_codon:yes stop_codon:yes gene_type:complete